MNAPRIWLLTDGTIWMASGCFWYFLPATLVRHWLGAQEPASRSARDLARGFGLALVHGASLEVYAASADVERKMLDCIAIARLGLVCLLLFGWVAFHADTFYERFGFWGSAISLVPPIGYMIAAR